MAQVQKFQKGGVLNLNGKQYTAEQINEYLNHSDFSSQERAALAGTINAIASGSDRTLDANANSISGSGADNDFINFFGSKKRADKNATGRSTRWSNRQARWNTDFHVANSAINKLSGIEQYYTKKSEQEKIKAENEANKNKVKLDVEKAKAKQENILHKLNSSGEFYNNNGEFFESVDTAETKNRISRILSAIASQNLDDYNLSEWSGDKSLNGLKTWWDTLSENEKQNFTSTALWNRIKNNNLSDLDRNVLDKMGMHFEDKPRTSLEKSTNEKSASNYGISFEKNKDGRDIIIGNEQFISSPWLAKDLPFLEGTKYENGAIYNGVLYTKDELESNHPDLNNVFQQWRDLVTSSGNNLDYGAWYDKANNLGIRFVGDRQWTGSDSNYYNGYIKYNPQEYYHPAVHGVIDVDQPQDKYMEQLRYFKDVTDFFNVPEGFQIIELAVSPSNGWYPSHDYLIYNTNDGTKTFNDFNKYNITKKPTDAYAPAPRNVEMKSVIQSPNGGYMYAFPQQIAGNTIYHTVEGDLYYLDNGDNTYTLLDRDYIKPILNGEVEANVKNLENAKYVDPTTRTMKNVSNIIRFLPGAAPLSAAINLFYSKGGKIKQLPKKFSTGGIAQARNTVSIQSAPEGPSGLNQTHVINKDKGFWKSIDEDFTSTEKTQLIAAVGDLAGVAMTFIPGLGNIAGAVTGVAATGVQFAADVKKDGFDLGDLGSAGLSLLMDVGTLIPGIGTGIKVSKVVKVIKAASKPILKLLALSGVTQGVAVMEKIASGQDVSSEDLVTLCRGISSTAIGAKLVRDKIGDTNLSKMLEGQNVNATKAAIKTNPTAEIGGTTIDNVKLSDLKNKTKTQVEEYLKDKVKAKLEENGIAFDEKAHGADLSEKFGLTYNKGEFDELHWKKIFRKGFVGRKEGTVEWKPEAPPSEHSWLRHYVDPRLRNKTLGYDYGIASSNGKLGNISREQYDAAYNRVQSGQGTLEDHALLRRGLLQPNAFGFEFEEAPRNLYYMQGVNWTPTYRKTLSEVPTRRVNQNVEMWDEKTGQWITPVRKLEAPVQGPVKNITPETNREIIGINFDGTPVYAPEHISKITPGTAKLVSEWSDLHRNGLDGYKEGGKIKRGNMGLADIENPDKYKNWKPTIKPQYTYYDALTNTTRDLFTGNNTEDSNKRILTSLDFLHKVPTKSIDSDSRIGNPVSEKFPIGDIIKGIGTKGVKIANELGFTLGGLNKQLDYVDKNNILTNSIVTTNVPEYYGSLNYDGKDIAHENAAKNIELRAYYDSTNDPVTNRVFRQNADSEARKIRLQGALSKSYDDSKYKDKYLDVARTYADKRTTNLNKDLLRHVSGNISANIEKSKGEAIKTDAMKKATSDAISIYNDLQLADIQSKLVDEGRKYQDWMLDQKELLATDVRNGIVSPEMNINAYINKDDDKLKALRKFQDTMSDLYQRRSLYVKKGGKFRPTSEQIKIDSEKARYKELQQLSKQSFEILKKALS